MPTSLSGLALFVALLTPGFVYLVRTESRLPGQQYSALRETALVVSVSVLTNGLVLAAFGVFRMARPNASPDVGLIMRTPMAYVEEHYLQVLLWAGGMLAASVGLAAMFAVPPAWFRATLRYSDGKLVKSLSVAAERRGRAAIAPESGWGTAFHKHPDRVVHLGLRLQDGTYMYGQLLTFNPQIEESADRSLQLLGPVDIRTPSADQSIRMDADVVLVSASQIKTMSIHYLPAE